MMKKTGIYIRLTRGEIEEYEFNKSIKAMRENLTSYCDTHHLTAPEIYCEKKFVNADDLTGRKEWARLVGDIKKGEVDALVVRHLDRLFRGVGMQLEIKDLLTKYNVELHTLNGKQDIKSAAGEFMMNIMSSVAQMEKRRDGERIWYVVRQKYLDGEYKGGVPPYGHISQKRYKRELTKKGIDKRKAAEKACLKYPDPLYWYVDDVEAKTIKLISNLYIKKNMGSHRIAVYLNDNGYRQRSGKLWRREIIITILLDPAVIGYTNFNEVAYQNKVRTKRTPKHLQEMKKAVNIDPILDKRKWDMAFDIYKKKTLKNRNNIASPKTKINFLLSNIIICGKCGTCIVSSNKSYKNQPFGYYQCRHRKLFGSTQSGCDFPIYPYKPVEEAVIGYLSKTFSNPLLIEKCIQKAYDKIPKSQKNRINEIKSKVNEIATFKNKKQDYFNYFDDASSDTKRDMLKRVEGFNVKIIAAEKELEELKRDKPIEKDVNITKKEASKYFGQLNELLNGKSEQLKELINILHVKHNFTIQGISKNTLISEIHFSVPGLTLNTTLKLNNNKSACCDTPFRRLPAQ